LWIKAMRSLAPKKAESEFDDLLGQLVDELAMTPASQSAVDFVPEAPKPAHVDSTQALAVEAAAAAQARVVAPPPVPANSNTVKIAGIIAAAVSAVAITALFVLGNQNQQGGDEARDEPATDLAPPQLEAALPPTPTPVQPAPVVIAPVPTPPQPVVTAPVEPPEPVQPKPRNRNKPKPKPKPDVPPDTDSEFDKL
jgi:hypothetical protein